MSPVTDDVLELVADLRPRPEDIDTAFPPDRAAAVLAQARNRSRSPRAERFVPRRSAGRRSALRPAIAGVGVGLAAAAAVVGAVAGRGGSDRPPAIPVALDRLATAASTVTTLPDPGRHRYLYRMERVRETTPRNERDGTPETDVSVVRLWTRADGDRYRAESSRRFASAFHFRPDRPADYAAPDRRFLAMLPSNPERLYAYLGHHSSGGHARFNALRDMLVSGVPTARERATMIRALGFVPGVRITEHVVDPAGRPAVLVRHQGSGEVDSIYFDPTNSTITAETDLWSWRGHRYGTETTVLHVRVVAHPPADVLAHAHRVG